MNEPKWDQVPTDEEILLARSVLSRLAHAVPLASPAWDALVESRLRLTQSVHYLSAFPGHTRHYRKLWNRMLEQDR